MVGHWLDCSHTHINLARLHSDYRKVQQFYGALLSGPRHQIVRPDRNKTYLNVGSGRISCPAPSTLTIFGCGFGPLLGHNQRHFVGDGFWMVFNSEDCLEHFFPRMSN
jgi:hypothetical protein